MTSKRKIVELSSEDKALIKKKVVTFDIGLIVSLGLLVFSIYPLFAWSNLTLTIFLDVIGLAGTAGFLYMKRLVGKDLVDGSKTIIQGFVDSLEIKQSGNKITYQKQPNQRVKISVDTPNGFKELDQNLVLGAGEKDLFFYMMTIDGVTLKLSRSAFFSLETGDHIEVAFSASQQVLHLKRK